MTKNKVSSSIGKNIVLILVAFVLIFTLILVSKKFPKLTDLVERASSATYYDFHGQAWSDNIGWISFNCLEGGATQNDICATSNYKVGTDATGLLSGYAWSDNVGWIDFGQTSGCPSAPCQGTLTAGGLTGWARVISPFIPTDPHPDRGGWDGWIDLSQISRSGNDLNGAAWGDINLGWLSLNCINGGPTQNNICGTSNYKVYVTANVIPDPTLTFNVPSHLYVNQSGTFTWATTNVDTCSASTTSSGPAWTGSKTVPSGSQSMGPYTTQGLYSYNMGCHNNLYNLDVVATRALEVTDGVCSGGETVPGNPYDCTSVVTRFEANPKIVREGRSSTLEWTIAGAQNCRLYSPTNVVLVNIPDGNQTGTYGLTNINQKATYRIGCLGGVNSYATVSIYLLYEN
jgi:hypothetical protein